MDSLATICNDEHRHITDDHEGTTVAMDHERPVQMFLAIFVPFRSS